MSRCHGSTKTEQSGYSGVVRNADVSRIPIDHGFESLGWGLSARGSNSQARQLEVHCFVCTSPRRIFHRCTKESAAMPPKVSAGACQAVSATILPA